MELYRDDWCIFLLDEENNIHYATILLDLVVMPYSVGMFIANKIKQNVKHGFDLLDMYEKNQNQKSKIKFKIILTNENQNCKMKIENQI